MASRLPLEDDFVVLGRMSPESRLAKLQEIDPATPAPTAKGLFSWGVPRPYEHTTHAFGYLAPGAPAAALVEVAPATAIQADPSLKRRRIRITLDRMRVAAYPGGGLHRVLLEVDAQNQRADGTDDLHFAMTFRVQESESAAVVGYPVFVGLGVGEAGIAFRGHTINVKNEDDEALLSFLESDGVNSGLELVETAQPALKPLSRLALGLAKSMAKRHRNVAVQEFFLGLDFGTTATGARLREGTYFAVQAPEEVVASCWSDWAFNSGSGQLVKRADATPIGYNYLAFGISRHQGP